MSHWAGRLASECEVAKVCGKGVFRYELHRSLLHLTFNEIGNNKFIFPGAMVHIAMLHSHFTWKRFQQKILWGGEGGLGFLPSF